jgi:hypothetical protein
MITDIQAQHYLFEVVRETDLGGRLFRRFESAADTWLRVDHALNADGRTTWTGTEAEREMEEAIEGMLSNFARISLFFFPERTTGNFGVERANRLRQLTLIAKALDAFGSSPGHLRSGQWHGSSRVLSRKVPPRFDIRQSRDATPRRSGEREGLCIGARVSTENAR